MDLKIEKLLEFLKPKKVGVFCDNANLYHAYEENMAWELRQYWHIYLNRIRDIIEFKE